MISLALRCGEAFIKVLKVPQFEVWNGRIHGCLYHMGGIRMGDDISTSVVDKNCKLHESPNTYIAGSAVFPTSGWANPTVTIMALAERLGDHLCNKMVNN